MNEKILLVGIELPFIKWEDSWFGYGINYFHQLLCMTYFFAGSICSLCNIICFVTSGLCQFDVLKILLNEINEFAIENKNGSNDDKIGIKIKFLATTHNNLNMFLHDLEETFAAYYFLDFISLVFQKTIEIFAISTVSVDSFI